MYHEPEEKPHMIDTPAGPMDCNPSHSNDPYIPSGSKPKRQYDRSHAGRKARGEV